MEMEIWKDLPDFKGVIQVSNMYRARSMERVITYGNRKRRISQKFLKTYVKDGIMFIRHKVQEKTVRINIIKEVENLFDAAELSARPEVNPPKHDLSAQIIYLVNNWEKYSLLDIKKSLINIAKEVDKSTAKLHQMKSYLVNISKSLETIGCDLIDKKNKDIPIDIESYEGETWKAVDEFPNYEVSTCGRIRRKIQYSKNPSLDGSYHYLAGHRNHRTILVCLTNNGLKRCVSLDKLILKTFTQTEGRHIKHLDGNKENCNLENLAWKE